MVLDLPLQLLLEQLQHSAQRLGTKPILWIADEHLQPTDFKALATHSTLDVLCNRYDLYQAAQTQGIKALFNDFQARDLAHTQYALIALRLPKEKTLYRYLLAFAAEYLCVGGTLLLSGAKNEGLKTALSFCQTLFQPSVQKLARKKTSSCYALSKTLELCSNQRQHCQLITEEYLKYQAICSAETPIYSKPGQYGWRKIDRGSALLASHYPLIYSRFNKPPQHFLDLGCGYGYLTLKTQGLDIAQRSATDNNAAALASCQYNCQRHDIECNVWPSDVAKHQAPSFDWIVCNPPFHQGFFTQPKLLDTFLQQTHRLLSKHNNALASYVSNQFIPLQRQASQLFSHVECIDSQHGFNVHLLQH